MISKPYSKTISFIFLLTFAFSTANCQTIKGWFKPDSKEDEEILVLPTPPMQLINNPLESRAAFTRNKSFLLGYVNNSSGESIDAAAVKIGVGDIPEETEFLYELTTNDQGMFSIEGIPYGYYLIVIAKTGYDVIWDYIHINRNNFSQTFSLLQSSIPEEISSVDICIISNDSIQEYSMSYTGWLWNYEITLPAGEYYYYFTANGIPYPIESYESDGWKLTNNGFIASRKIVQNSGSITFTFNPNSRFYNPRVFRQLTHGDIFFFAQRSKIFEGTQTDAFEHILNIARTKKIIMLGEGDSHQSLNNLNFLLQVIPILVQEHNLKYIVLEFNQSKIHFVESYMETGDEKYLYYIIDSVFPGEWTNSYEFLELFRLVRRINQSMQFEYNHINFIFPEADMPAPPDPDASPTEWNRYNYTISNEVRLGRDFSAFNYLKRFIHQDRENARFLIYYGSAHTQKIASPDLQNPLIERQWLGKLLTDEFGNSVYSIFLRSKMSVLSRNVNPVEIYLDRNKQPNTLYQFMASRDNAYDAFVVLDDYMKSTPFYKLNTEHVIDFLINTFDYEMIRNYQDNHSYCLSKYLADRLRRLTGKSFGYYQVSPVINRDTCQSRWESWWQQNKSQLDFTEISDLSSHQHFELFYRFGVFHYEKGNYERAIDFFTDTNSYIQDDPEVLFYLGMSNYYIGDFESSILYFNTLEELGEIMRGMYQLPYIYLTRSVIYNTIGESGLAHQEFNKFLELEYQDTSQEMLDLYYEVF